MIEITSLSKKYGSSVQALNNVDLSIGTGMFGLLGPNGAGKTTLMRILAGIVNPSSGTVHVDGKDISTESGRQTVKSFLGYLPQELGVYPELNATQFVDYMAILKGMVDPRERRERVAKVLEMVGLNGNAAKNLKGFSGGMKRRVGIAQALVNDPKILIVDEPTAGLDPEERIRFRNLLVNLASDRTVLLSTHIVEDIQQTCCDMAVLSQGRVLFRGGPADMIHACTGHVWSLTASAIEPTDNGLTIISMQHLEEGIQYRLVGDSMTGLQNAQPAQPSLEDGYVWLMKSTRQVIKGP
jgi:ABC-type multidrug transport system ATPase subunit